MGLSHDVTGHMTLTRLLVSDLPAAVRHTVRPGQAHLVTDLNPAWADDLPVDAHARLGAQLGRGADASVDRRAGGGHHSG